MISSVALLMASMLSPHPAPEPISAGAGFAARGLAGCPSDLRYLNQLTGWQIRWRQDWDDLAHASDDQILQAISLWEKAPEALRRDQEALASRQNAPAPRVIVGRVLPQVEQLSLSLASAAPPLRKDASPAVTLQWKALFQNRIAPAIASYADFLRNKYRPEASSSPGLAHIAGGEACFKGAVRTFNAEDIPPGQLEERGRRIIRETEGELAALLRIEPANLSKRLAELRDVRDPAFDRDALLRISQSAAERGARAMPMMFARPAQSRVIFEAVPAPMESSFTAAGYLGSHGDGPPIALLNLSRPHERKLTAEAIAFHESLPGHHVMEALGYSIGTAPNSAFFEGWGMYAERLADEMHLYSGDNDRIGMLARRLAAAARPMIEVGLHVRGWTRAKAIAYLRGHSVLSDADVEVEVDRMIAGPGQPSSYIIGYDRLMELRNEARRSLGSDFDMRQFHGIVLAKGSRPLSQVSADVAAWAAMKRTSPVSKS